MKRVLSTFFLLATTVCLGVMPLGAQSAVDGLTIPSRPAHGGMVYWTPARLAQAKLWYAAHPFTPKLSKSLYLPWTDILFHHLLTGSQADCDAAYTLFSDPGMVPVTPATGYIAANQTRWYGEWQVLTYDWCYDALTPTQRSGLATTINTWMTVMMRPTVFPGKRSSPFNNYFWGDVRNELEWGLASYNDQPAQAKVFLDDVLAAKTGRWDNFKADIWRRSSRVSRSRARSMGSIRYGIRCCPLRLPRTMGATCFRRRTAIRMSPKSNRT